MDNTKLFSQKSEDYSRFRPSYPDAAIDWLRQRCQGESVVDVGAGTGIFTKALTRVFKNVCAVEPNAMMREEFLQFLPEVDCILATGENTSLPAASVDLITVAQAFHWLNEDEFKHEAIRILRPEGKIAIVWNSSVKDDFTIARDAICRKYCPRFSKGYAGKRTPAEGDEFLRNTYFKKVEVVSFSNPFVMDLQTFEGNIRSRSYALLPDNEEYASFMAELRMVFDKFAGNGVVTEFQNTQIYLGGF